MEVLCPEDYLRNLISFVFFVLPVSLTLRDPSVLFNWGKQCHAKTMMIIKAYETQR
jgi:hypothetical protein